MVVVVVVVVREWVAVGPLGWHLLGLGSKEKHHFAARRDRGSLRGRSIGWMAETWTKTSMAGSESSYRSH